MLLPAWPGRSPTTTATATSQLRIDDLREIWRLSRRLTLSIGSEGWMSKLEKEFDEIGNVDDSNNDNFDEVDDDGDDVMFLAFCSAYQSSVRIRQFLSGLLFSSLPAWTCSAWTARPSFTSLVTLSVLSFLFSLSSRDDWSTTKGLAIVPVLRAGGLKKRADPFSLEETEGKRCWKIR